MRVVVTGGGTGGHVYPALEIAKQAREDGADVVYLGSERGVEGAACERLGLMFHGFKSEPIYNPKSPAGVIGLAKMWAEAGKAKKMMEAMQPDVVFSTGGYSSAPVMKAATSLGIPLAIHVCDSVPGRSLRQFAKKSTLITSTFRSTENFLKQKVIRTGHPIRTQLREAIGNRNPNPNLVLVVGGSGGSKFLNDMIPKAALQGMSSIEFIHSAGPKQYEQYRRGAEAAGPNYKMVPYLDALEMSQAYQRASLVIARSGSGISEFAMAGIPSVLVPLPSSTGNHQFHNAEEFRDFGGASILTENEVTGEVRADMFTLVDEIIGWRTDVSKAKIAESALSEWDSPSATQLIWHNLLRSIGK